MAQPYNLTNISASRDFLQLTQAVGGLTGNLLGLGILILVFAVSLLTTASRGIKEALGFSMWMTTLTGLFLMLIGLIEPYIFIICVVLLAIYIVWLIIGGEKY